MPQRTQHSLVYILLLWTAVVSIIQIVLTVLFFTTGHNGLSQNCSAVEQVPDKSPHQQHSTPSPFSMDVLQLGPGKMVTFTASIDGSDRIEWITTSSDAGVIDKEGVLLKIHGDGWYFLNLQVSSCDNLEHTVRLRRKEKIVLEGWINTKTKTTGILSKVELMSAGVELEVTIDPAIECINPNASATHLDIIFMAKTSKQ